MPTDHERDCPKCGDTTTVTDREGYNPLRKCDNDDCNWVVEISTYA